MVAILILGVVALAIGVTLQAGATGAVRAMKLSTKLLAGGASGAAEAPRPRQRAS